MRCLPPRTANDLLPNLRGGNKVGRRSGIVAFELLLLLPIFVVILLGFVQITTIVVVEERLAAASEQGARAASQGGSVMDIDAAVRASLGPGKIRDNIKPVILDPADPVAAPSGTPLKVRVEVEASKVIPDYLRFIGFSLASHTLVGQTVMRKE